MIHPGSVFGRHEFVIRRLHSLTGLVPIGGYLCFHLATNAVVLDGRQVAPVAWECNCLEEVCGACTMVINGRDRQACTALVDQLLAARPGEIELRPMTKFPVLRDLVVDRSRIFAALHTLKKWFDR